MTARVSAALSLAALLVGSVVLADDATTKAIEQRTRELVTAWDHHDAKAMASLFASNGDLINPYGRWAKGRAEVEKLLQAEHATFLKGSSISITTDSVRLAGPGAAVADQEDTITGITAADGSPVPTLSIHATVVWVHASGKWWVMALRPAIAATMPGSAPK